MFRREVLKRLAKLFPLFFLPALWLACKPAQTVADIVEGAACGLAYAELGTMPNGCQIPVPLMRQRADDLERTTLAAQAAAKDASAE